MALSLYMDNFRGFKKTTINVEPITFLVGENSTGKSSLLKLLRAFSQPQFWFNPESVLRESAELGNYDDMVSVNVNDKSSFTIGFMKSYVNKDDSLINCAFTILNFKNSNGSPSLYKYIHFQNGILSKLIYQKNQMKYKQTTLETKHKCNEEIIKFFNKVIETDATDTRGYKIFPPDELSFLPAPIAISVLKTPKKASQLKYSDLSSIMPFAFDLTWIAPIRTKPQRFYDSTKRSYSPEGDHIPFILQRELKTKVKSRNFIMRLKAFGEASGLYETILPKSFGSDAFNAPFEINIVLSGANLNLSNVGYGVSQILPLIVEFIYRKEQTIFAVQQPEVHLHPRAQAAFGDLIADLAVEKNHIFIIETHSDYLIDRCRLNMSKREDPPKAQVIFFQRTNYGNLATEIRIGSDGKYNIDEQPLEFREFFIKEEMGLLEV